MKECEITGQNWNGHFAFMHIKELANHKELYLNGKPLKWYNRFKNGDIVEIIEKPKGITAFLTSAAAVVTAFSAAHPIITTVIVSGIVGLVGTAATQLLSGNTSGARTTRNKEYSSTTQPELRGANNDISSDIIPVVFGRTQQTPSYAQVPFRLVNDGGSTNKYHQYFIPNYRTLIQVAFDGDHRRRGKRLLRNGN